MLFVEANGAKIPAIGLGTWELSGRPAARVVEQALRLGYRHIDTAQVYDNEREVGDGMRASGVRSSIISSRAPTRRAARRSGTFAFRISNRMTRTPRYCSSTRRSPTCRRTRTV